MLNRASDGLRAIELSLQLLNHRDSNVREQTWALLSELYGQDALIYLARLRDYGQSDVRGLARAALSGLTKLWGEVVPQPNRLLHVACMGAFRVYVGSRELQPCDWAGSGLSRGGGLKAQSMLAYLLHCGAAGATEDELIYAIWGDSPPSAGSFARTQSQLFDVLDGKQRGHGQCSFVVKSKRHLTLRPELCSSDVERLLQRWNHAQQTEHEHSLEAAVPFYTALVQHYDGHYMDSIPKGWDWHLERAQDLQSIYLGALERLATNEQGAGNYSLCRALCQQGLLVDRSDHLLTEKLLEAQAELGLAAEATRTFIYYLEATSLQPGSPDYHEDSVVQTYWYYWPHQARQTHSEYRKTTEIEDLYSSMPARSNTSDE